MESKLTPVDYIFFFAVAFGAIYNGAKGLLIKILLTHVPHMGVAITDNVAPAWAVAFAGEIVMKIDLLTALLIVNIGIAYLSYKMICDLKEEVNKQ